MVHHGNAECDLEIKRYLAYSKKIKSHCCLKKKGITLLSFKLKPSGKQNWRISESDLASYP